MRLVERGDKLTSYPSAQEHTCPLLKRYCNSPRKASRRWNKLSHTETKHPLLWTIHFLDPCSLAFQCLPKAFHRSSYSAADSATSMSTSFSSWYSYSYSSLSSRSSTNFSWRCVFDTIFWWIRSRLQDGSWQGSEATLSDQNARTGETMQASQSLRQIPRILGINRRREGLRAAKRVHRP